MCYLLVSDHTVLRWESNADMSHLTWNEKT